jgi:TatD DNase family protein
MLLVDAHNHLHSPRLALYPNVLSECRRVQIVRQVVNGTCESDWSEVKALVSNNADLIPSFGLHPWFLENISPSWKESLLQFLDSIPSAIGEIGLDGWKKPSDPALQDRVFAEQLEIAAQRNIPASIHGLRAWGRVLKQLQGGPVPSCGVLLHSYGGPADLLEPLQKVGAYFSCPSFFLRRGNEGKLQLFKEISLDRILIESDAPDQALPAELDSYGLSDSSNGSRINHPALIVKTYSTVAALRGMQVEELAAQVHENFRRLFGGF